MSASVTIADPRNTMPIRLTLVGHYTERRHGEFSFGTTAITIKLSDQLTVQMPAPFLPIGNDLGITPQLVPDGDTALRIDFTHWSPLRYGMGGVHQFPFTFTGQDLAVKVCRAFDANPHMTWQHTPTEIEAWLREWGPANGLRF